MWSKSVCVVFCAIVTSGYCEPEPVDSNGLNIVLETIDKCLNTNESYSCISEKVARAVERSMDRNIPLLDGMTLVRNNETINHRQARLLGFDHLSQAIQNFFQTHVVSLELGGARQLVKEGGGLGGIGGGGFNKKALKREKKYMHYAFMVLLGIFGLTGPLVMKVLALMAAKAILAAKAALIIVGSVALKKLFEKDRHEPAIKVHTISHDDDDDDHDRLSKYGLSGYGYESSGNGGQYYNNYYPYSGYYDSYYSNNFTKDSKVR